MIILGVILLILGFVMAIPLLWWIGLILILVDVVLIATHHSYYRRW